MTRVLYVILPPTLTLDREQIAGDGYMNQSLAELVQKRRISREEALNRSTLPEELAGLLGSAGAASGAPAAAASAGSSPFGRR